MPILNYRTSIAASQTVGEMQAMLAKHGATTVAASYDNGIVVGLSFRLMTPHGWRDFTLPVDVDAIERVLKRQKVAPKLRSREQAERVAWRIAKDWLAAQLAILQSQMVSFDQIMLPFMHVDGSKTLYQAYEERESALALTTGGE